MKNVEVLDCTLRDGSYLINFQFNTNDTYQISKLLEQAGLKYIEVGHGLGLDAGKDKGSSLENDLDYIRAAKQAVTTSKIGVFYIPGIGQMETIKQAVDAGLDFIRIGVNVTDYKKAEETINYAKGLGLEVWLNLMKSYTVSLQEWRTICEYLKTMKCDHLAVVDSAGGMIPKDVKAFCQIAKEVTPFGIGFHGHNNMQLAIANCLAAIEGGATIVDGTLFGMGRSGGNANTEILAAVFKREGIIPSHKYDTELLIEIANTMIAPISRKNPGDGAVELAAGVNYFHSSFYSTVKKACDETSSSIFRTILNLPIESRSIVTSEMVTETIKKLNYTPTLSPAQRLKESNTLYIKDFSELSKYLREVSSKTNCKVAISVSQTSALSENFRVSNIYTLEETIVGHIEFSDLNQLPTLIESLRNQVNYWFLDSALKDNKIVHQLPTQEYFYFDEKQLEENVLRNELINSSKKILCLKNNSVAIDETYACKEIDTTGNLLILGNRNLEINETIASQLTNNDQIIMTHKCNISEETWELINSKNISVVRLNYTLPLAYEILKIIKNKEIIQASRGKTQKRGIEIVSGGFVSKKGAVIVDNVKNPTIILGLTDGQGGVEMLPGNMTKLQEIRSEIFFDTK